MNAVESKTYHPKMHRVKTHRNQFTLLLILCASFTVSVMVMKSNMINISHLLSCHSSVIYFAISDFTLVACLLVCSRSPSSCVVCFFFLLFTSFIYLYIYIWLWVLVFERCDWYIYFMLLHSSFVLFYFIPFLFHPLAFRDVFQVKNWLNLAFNNNDDDHEIR